MDAGNNGNGRSEALSLLATKRPRNLGGFGAGGLLFGDWGTSRLYVLGLAFLVAGRSRFCHARSLRDGSPDAMSLGLHAGPTGLRSWLRSARGTRLPALAMVSE